MQKRSASLDWTRIESSANPRFRELLALAQSAQVRRRAGRSLLEGHKLIEAFLDRPGAGRDHGSLSALYLAESALGRDWVADLVDRAPYRPVVIADRLLERASRQPSPDGVIAVVETPAPDLPPRLEGDLVYLDRLQDPGNLGTILRSCAAAGIARVITAPDTVFAWSPKVLRAGMGAHFALTIHESVEPARLWSLIGRDRPVWATVAADAPGVISLHDADLAAAGVWLFGAEGQGLHPDLLDDRVIRITIPQQPRVESLNVAAAAAICLFEQRRQRGTGLAWHSPG